MPLPRCRYCGARVVFHGSPHTGRPRTFEPRPVNGHTHSGRPAYPLFGARTWRFRELVEVVQVQRESSLAEAEDEVRDMPWYLPHDCPRPDDDDAERTPA